MRLNEVTEAGHRRIHEPEGFKALERQLAMACEPAPA
jgi:hypothetical protein